MRNLDLRVIAFALLACYLLPWVAAGVLVSAVVPADGTAITGWRAVLVSSSVLFYFVAMPLAAGYFTARFSANRPQLHVLLVVLLGALGASLVTGNPWSTQLIMLAVSLVVASLGAFIAIRSAQR